MTVLAGGTFYSIRQAMYMDTAEYSFYKTGKDASAFIMSVFMLPTKIATALSVTLAAGDLEFIGYVPNVAPSGQFVSNLMDIICYIPATAGFLAFSIMLFYSLSDNKLSLIMEVNAKKRAEAGG